MMTPRQDLGLMKNRSFFLYFMAGVVEYEIPTSVFSCRCGWRSLLLCNSMVFYLDVGIRRRKSMCSSPESFPDRVTQPPSPLTPMHPPLP